MGRRSIKTFVLDLVINLMVFVPLFTLFFSILPPYTKWPRIYLPLDHVVFAGTLGALLYTSIYTLIHYLISRHKSKPLQPLSKYSYSSSRKNPYSYSLIQYGAEL